MKVRELARIRVVKARRAAKRLRFRRRRGPSVDPKNLRGAKGALRKSSEEFPQLVSPGASAGEGLLGESLATGPGRGRRVRPL